MPHEDKIAPDEVHEDRRMWRRRTLGLLGGLLVFRLVYLAIVPLDLIHDETYYWDWTRHLDWGYYSKPPMIAWVIGLSTWLGGSTAFMVRLPAALFGTAGLWVIHCLAARMYNARAGFWATAIAACAPGNAALNLLMTIDAPFLFFWSAALYCVWRALSHETAYRWWAMAAVATGLGLLSKQTMFGFPALLGLFVLLSAADRRQLAKPAIWLYGVGSLLFLAPVVWWNANNGWITLEHTRGHFERESVDLARRLTISAEYLLGQGGVISPITCILIAVVTLIGVLSFFKLPRRERFLICFSGVPLWAVFVLSFTQRVEPNWPAPFYTAAVVLLAGWGAHAVSLGRVDRLRGWMIPGVGVGAVFCAACYALPFVVGPLGIAGASYDPTFRLRGWREFGQRLEAERRAMPNPERTIIVSSASREYTSGGAFYSPRQPTIYTYSDLDGVTSQYDLWQGPVDKIGCDALILTHLGKPVPPELLAAFETVEPCKDLVIPIGKDRRLAVSLWRGRRLANWPAETTTHR
jgi:hypothetical protein